MAFETGKHPGRGLYGVLRGAQIATFGWISEGGWSGLGGVEMIPSWDPYLDPFIESMDTGVPGPAEEFASAMSPEVIDVSKEGDAYPKLDTLDTSVDWLAGKFLVRRHDDD